MGQWCSQRICVDRVCNSRIHLTTLLHHGFCWLRCQSCSAASPDKQTVRANLLFNLPRIFNVDTPLLRFVQYIVISGIQISGFFSSPKNSLVLTRTCHSHFVLLSGTRTLLVKAFVSGFSVEGWEEKEKVEMYVKKLFSPCGLLLVF